MCLKVNSIAEPLIAEDDIVCYKCLYKDLISPCRHFKYEYGKMYETEFTYITNDKTIFLTVDEDYYVAQGFHTYTQKKDAFIDKNTIWRSFDCIANVVRNETNVHKCIIPKNSRYYVGLFDGRICYCSDKLIVEGIVA